MKKTILAIIAVMFFASTAIAAVSSPCGVYKKPAKEPAAPAETGHRRDVLDNRVPAQTVEGGALKLEKATQDRESVITGRG